MNAVESVTKTEMAIAGMTKAAKRQLFRRLAVELGTQSSAIEKRAEVMGGAACIRGTRIPVWMLEQARTQGVTEADLLRNYPGLTAEDLVNAWDYAVANRKEIAKAIEQNEMED
ncbi:MAG: DUF433 domain-containing protein [Pyrinomonadaceae bacterium]